MLLRFRFVLVSLGVVLLTLPSTSHAMEGDNTIRKDTFNFAHQLGYLYSRMNDAYFRQRGEWSFETGFMGYYTRQMPLVENPEWEERLLLQMPFELRIYPSDNIELQINSDLVAELPYRNRRSMGGNSPRFRTKMRLLQETETLPALAFTVGVKFSSAKPYNIWEGNHNYVDSNGLAGTGTGVADYFMVLHASRTIGDHTWMHTRLGLAPLGDPTAYERGSSQADQILYGLSLEHALSSHWQVTGEVSGMWGAIETTNLDHYSVARARLSRRFGTTWVTLNVERGLTWTSDDWVAGFHVRFDMGADEAASGTAAAGMDPVLPEP